MTQQIVALLGRRDEPTDGVEEYCRYLGSALRPHGFELALVRLSWKERGWSDALSDLTQRAKHWRGRWVCVQYTALAWSSRGFPLRFLSVLNLLHRVGARVAVVYHDAGPHQGSRALDKLRRAVQLHVMRRSLRDSDLAIFTVPLNAISWINSPPPNVAFIPVGANVPLPANNETNSPQRSNKTPRVAVFGITGGQAGRRESARIVDAMRFASRLIGKLELHAFGRHADNCESILREGLRDVPVDVQVQGVLPAEQVVSELCSADVMLFMRGAISTRRGSAIAGIACGLPVIAERGPETSGPIEEAGVVLVSAEKPGEFGDALLQVLANRDYRATLATRSRIAQDKYFSWPAIAARYAEELNAPSPKNGRLFAR
jgi:glycosyltransferase involved in cell wall biosynthesis